MMPICKTERERERERKMMRWMRWMVQYELKMMGIHPFGQGFDGCFQLPPALFPAGL